MHKKKRCLWCDIRGAERTLNTQCGNILTSHKKLALTPRLIIRSILGILLSAVLRELVSLFLKTDVSLQFLLGDMKRKQKKKRELNIY